MKGCTSFLIVLTISFLSLDSFAQQPSKYFTGTITYQLEVYDSVQNKFLATQSTSILVIDSIYVRSENESKLGLQILIKDIEADTATLLMTALGTDYALFMDFKEEKKKADNIEYKKKDKKKEFSGYQAKLFTYTKNKKEFEAYMTDEIDGRYIGVLNDLEGFPLQYSLDFGPQIVRYTCVGISTAKPTKDLFQTPEGYKRMTLDEFYESIQDQN